MRKIIESIYLKIILLITFYLIIVYFQDFKIFSTNFFYISLFFLVLFFLLFKAQTNKFKKIKEKFDHLYFSLFKKHKRHINLADVFNSIDFINDEIINKNENIIELEKSRSKFLGNVSHEIKTPLFLLQGYVDTLIQGAINDSSVNFKFLKKIKKQSDRLENLMEDLIKISMIESDELKLKIENVRFSDFLKNIKLNFGDFLTTRNRKLIIPDVQDDLFVKVDKQNMQIVFNNLINNAINYSDNGDIIIAAKLVKNKLNIKITDHGIGIEKKDFKRIFERFYRVDNDRSRSKGGTGLGLAIVKHILLAHDVKINIESRLKIGTTFTFSLPVQIS